MIVNDDTSVDTATEIGHGPKTVICLPGWFGSSTGWGQGFVDTLDRERLRYEFMDYRGYGERRGSGGPYTIDQIAQDVLELADEGEWSLLFFDGVFSHAVVKRAAAGEFRVQREFGGTFETVTPSATVRCRARYASSDSPCASAWPRARLRLSWPVAVRIRSPMPASPANVSWRAP